MCLPRFSSAGTVLPNFNVMSRGHAVTCVVCRRLWNGGRLLGVRRLGLEPYDDSLRDSHT